MRCSLYLKNNDEKKGNFVVELSGKTADGQQVKISVNESVKVLDLQRRNLVELYGLEKLSNLRILNVRFFFCKIFLKKHFR